jgi:hypothetical protein
MFKAVVTAVLLVATSPALACSCVYPAGSQSDHVRREYREAEAVFSGYVHSIHYSDVDGRPTRMAKLRVLQVWKGDLQPNTWIDVISDDEVGLVGCSYATESDRALMIYAAGRRPYALASCSLTGPLEGATRDIPLLNRLSGRQRSS